MSGDADRTLDERTVQGDEEPPLRTSAPPERYAFLEPLATGGMGEVQLFRDGHLGREVAIKSVRSSYAANPMVSVRFTREALVQARLEHPSIVPVYDVSGAAAGRASSFTMRRIAGRTLDTILAALAGGDAATQREYGPRRLLAAFARVCLCLDYAHRRGVVHRDLKPSNVIFGDFGEVYVLDWGVARVLDGAAIDPEGALGVQTHETAAGALVGTPGYMSPEQARGELAHIDGRSDVFSLGAILFEILTGTKLYPEGAPREVAALARQGTDARPSLRATGIAPELDVICATACAFDPAQRYPDARALHDAVQRYLEGDRDRELREKLVSDQLERGRALVAEALAPGAGDDVRREAARVVGRAVALDPASDEALRLMSSLVLSPSADAPAEVDRELAEERTAAMRLAAKAASAGYFGFSCLFLVVLWMGVQSWRWVALTFGASLLAGIAAWIGGRTRVHSVVPPLVVVACCVAGLTGLSRMFGPLIALPSLAVLIAASFAVRPVAISRAAFSGALSAVIAGVMAAEMAGLLPRSYRFEGGAMLVVPQMNALPEAATSVFLTAASVFAILVTSAFIGRVQSALEEAERALRIHTWYLRQVFRT